VSISARGLFRSCASAQGLSEALGWGGDSQTSLDYYAWGLAEALFD